MSMPGSMVRPTKRSGLAVALLVLCGALLSGCSMLGIGKDDPDKADKAEVNAKPAAAAAGEAQDTTDPSAIILEQLAPDPTFVHPEGETPNTHWQEVFRIGGWIKGDAEKDNKKWILTTETERDWGATLVDSIVSNILVLPMILLGLFGLVLLLQRLHKVSESVARTQDGLNAVREQMAIPERS